MVEAVAQARNQGWTLLGAPAGRCRNVRKQELELQTTLADGASVATVGNRGRGNRSRRTPAHTDALRASSATTTDHW